MVAIILRESLTATRNKNTSSVCVGCSKVIVMFFLQLFLIVFINILSTLYNTAKVDLCTEQARVLSYL